MPQWIWYAWSIMETDNQKHSISHQKIYPLSLSISWIHFFFFIPVLACKRVAIRKSENDEEAIKILAHHSDRWHGDVICGDTAHISSLYVWEIRVSSCLCINVTVNLMRWSAKKNDKSLASPKLRPKDVHNQFGLCTLFTSLEQTRWIWTACAQTQAYVWFVQSATVNAFIWLVWCETASGFGQPEHDKCRSIWVWCVCVCLYARILCTQNGDCYRMSCTM